MQERKENIMELVELKKSLYKDKRAFEVALGCDEKTANKYLIGIYNTIVNNDKLQKCKISSIINAAVTSATLGIPVDANNFAYLIAYGDKVQFQMSYKGYVYIAKQDKDVDNISSVLVYPDDEFKVDIGNNTISHIPDLDSPHYGNEKDIKFVYSIVRFKANTGRAQMFEILTRKQVDEIRLTSKSGGAKDKYGNPTIWERHYGEMARKTAIKRLCKHAQLGNISLVDQIDNADYEDKIINVTPQGELLVESADSQLVNKIINDVNECSDLTELGQIQAKYQDSLQELMLYNINASKKILKVMGLKEDSLFSDKIISIIQSCEDEDGLDKVWGAHEKRINQLKTKDRNQITEIYCDKKQFLYKQENNY